jgi:hypothetical protein
LPDPGFYDGVIFQYYLETPECNRLAGVFMSRLDCRRQVIGTGFAAYITFKEKIQ